ncbi:hypothetical protein [Paraburkholderia sp. DHOC27]|uniref:hypothetical protein n=1 Tax=Paraburkholderia sp. DHOC27 TaxID=2303330 RepID=UPI000E3BBD45|nr:hypothetical protein [Paraburkholderia sp. DHOC27]RFU48392.1 hypothetical protein D0B32_00650 [Paraburkholderia sp. DHOC27]
MKAPSMQTPTCFHQVAAIKSSTVDMLRAYLITAALAAMSIQVAALVAMDVFGVSEQFFTSSLFRMCAAVVVAAAVLIVKHVANVVYCSAVAHRYATLKGANGQRVAVSLACPVRALVILHLRFERRRFELAGAHANT